MKRSSSEGAEETEQDLVGSSSEFQNRKKRRGMIEKKRRDRINESLIELQHLVPMAMEKKGTSKLEKAELLEMTVNHMRNLLQTNKNAKENSKGNMLSYGTDSNNNNCVNSDYKAAGFMKCASEIDNFLTSMDGSGKENPSRYRLIRHLNDCCSRISSKTTSSEGNGTAVTASTHANVSCPVAHFASSSVPSVGTVPHYRGIVPAAVPSYSWLGTSSINLGPMIPVRLPDGTSIRANSFLHSSVALSPPTITPLFAPVPPPVRFTSMSAAQAAVRSAGEAPI